MFLLIPVSHDSMTARRWPWVTVTLIALNFLVHVTLSARVDTRAIEETGQRALQFHVRHPKLIAKPPLDMIEQNLHVRPADWTDLRKNAKDDALLPVLQEKLDMLCDDFAAALHKLPSFAYGYTPARPRVINLFTYQFLHEGWLHLIFNMWFLWLVGCYVEDAWGRVLFPAFYLTAGLIAAFSHQAVTPDSSGPLIGASGAVAGAMGAFLVRFLRTNIRFWYFVWLIRPFLGFFYAPAFVMLPLWLGTQVFSAFSGSGDGVAYAAHVGGFVFGVIVALAVKWSGHEKLVDHLVEKQLSWTQDPRLLAAGTHIDTGELDTAITMLEQLAREQPMQVDIQLELLRAAKAKRDPELEARAYAGCARAYMPQLPDKAVEMFYEAVQHDRALAMPRELVLRIGRYLASQGATERAVDVFSALHVDGGIDAPALHALIAHGDLAFAVGDRATAADLFERASTAPHPHTELESMLQKKLTAARS